MGPDALFEHLCLQFDPEHQQALQTLTGLVLGPAVMVIVQTGVNFMPIGQIDTTNCGVTKNLVVQTLQFSLIMFESAHVVSIP